MDNYIDIILISNGEMDPALERERNFLGLCFVHLVDLDDIVVDADFQGFWHIY